MKRVTRLLITLTALIFPFQISLAAIQSSDEPWEKVSVRAGGFLTALNTSVRIGLTEGSGIDIDLEGALGIESSMWALRADALYRFSKNRRHRLDLSYVGYFRSATRTTTEDIPIGDDTIVSGTEVETTYNLQIIKLLYSWSFFMDDRIDLGLGGGLYLMPISLKITPQSGPVAPKKQDLTAPLPVLDLHMDFAITPKWYFKQKYSFFYLAIGNFRGGIIDTELDIEYRFWKYAGVGLGYNSFRLGIQADNPDEGSFFSLNGKIETTYNGLLLYAKFYF